MVNKFETTQFVSGMKLFLIDVWVPRQRLERLFSDL